MSIGMDYGNWYGNKANWEKLQTGKDTTFQYANGLESAKDGANKLAKSRIDIFDKNKNGGMDYDEYLAEQKSLLAKAFGDAIDMDSPEMQEATKKYFETVDVNKDGVIDTSEMATTFLMTDYSDGNFDGKLSLETTAFMPWESIDSSKMNVYKNAFDRLFKALDKSKTAEKKESATVPIGQQYENWLYDKNNIANRTNENLKFTYIDMTNVAPENKLQTIQKGLLDLASSRIELFDKNNNGKLEENEFNDCIGKLTLDKNKPDMFKTYDMNKDGVVDVQEMATAFAYIDAYDGDNRINGEIVYKSNLEIDWADKKVGDSMAQYKGFLFPEN